MIPLDLTSDIPHLMESIAHALNAVAVRPDVIGLVSYPEPNRLDGLYLDEETFECPLPPGSIVVTLVGCSHRSAFNIAERLAAKFEASINDDGPTAP